MATVIAVTTTLIAGRRDPQQWQAAGRYYLEAVEAAGGLPLLLPVLAGPGLGELLSRADGLLLTGGGDLDPALYGQAPHPRLGLVSPERDRTELELLAWAVEHQLPTLGICRGAQVMVVGTGGSLVQDIPSQVPHALAHRGEQEPGRVPHPVSLQPGSLVAAALEATRVVVNSTHHQCSDKLGPGLVPTAWADDGLVEAVELSGHPFLLGVQWHPEELWQEDREHLKLFQALVRAAGG